MTLELTSLDLSNAEGVYTVSNVPLYLLERLRADDATQKIARDMSADAIFSALKRAIRRIPRTSRDTVLPYVLLVALSMKNAPKLLVDAKKLAAHRYKWFDYLCAVLITTSQATEFRTLNYPLLTSSIISGGSSVANLIVRDGT